MNILSPDTQMSNVKQGDTLPSRVSSCCEQVSFLPLFSILAFVLFLFFCIFVLFLSVISLFKMAPKPGIEVLPGVPEHRKAVT